MSMRAREQEGSRKSTPEIDHNGNRRFDEESKRIASRSNDVRRRSSTVWRKRSG